MQGINIQKYSNVFLEKRVFFHVSRFDEISEAVFETGTSLTKKAEQERKRSQNVTRIELCLTKWQGQAVSGSRNEERERERERVRVCV